MDHRCCLSDGASLHSYLLDRREWSLSAGHGAMENHLYALFSGDIQFESKTDRSKHLSVIFKIVSDAAMETNRLGSNSID